MKRLILAMLIALTIVVLASCGSRSVDSDAFEVIPDAESADLYVSDDVGNGKEVEEEPSQNNLYNFNSYSELTFQFSKEAIKDKSIVQKQKSMNGTKYQTFVDSLTQTDEIKLPVIDGKPMKLRNKEGYSNITLFTKEAYDLPWVWFHCIYNEEDITVKTTYPSIVTGIDLSSATSVSDKLKLFAPDAVNVQNYQKYSNYKKVYEKTVELSGGPVSALIYELKDSEKIYVKFFIDDVFVSVHAKASTLNDAFWKLFDMSADDTKA